MTNNEAYLKSVEDAKDLDPRTCKRPTESVRGYLGKCQVMYTECKKDIEALKAVGLDETKVDLIRIYTLGLSIAEANWMDVYRQKRDAMEKWSSSLADSYEFKEVMINDFSFAFRKHPELLTRIEMLRDGSTHDDMIQDLREISVTGRKHVDLLTAIGFDTTKLDEAEAMYTRLFELKALATGEKNEVHPSLNIRNQIYTLLYDIMQDVKDYVRYVYWRDLDNLNRFLIEK